MSSWWAVMQRCVVRARAAAGSRPSGTKTSAFGLSELHGVLLYSFLRPGRLAAATAWPCRFSFSPGTRTRIGLGQFRELLFHHFAGHGEDEVAALAGHHAAQHEQVADLVEIREVGDGVAEVDADGFVDLARARVARGHQFLHFHQLFGQRHLLRQVDAGGGKQPAHGLLGEVLHAHALVARPLVHGGVFAVVHRARRPARSASR